jgi:MFS family permease
MREGSPGPRDHAFVLLCGAVFFDACGIGALFPPLARIQAIHHLHVYALGLMSGANFFAALAAQLVVGRLLDGERARRVLLVGVMLGSLSVLWFAHGQNLGQLVASRALQGLSYGIIGPASLREAAVGATGERRGGRLGILSSAMMAGIVIGPLVGSVLADVGGVALPFEVIAGLLAAVFVAILFNRPARVEAAPSGVRLSLAGAATDGPGAAATGPGSPAIGPGAAAMDGFPVDRSLAAGRGGAAGGGRQSAGAWRAVVALLLLGAASQLPNGLYDALWSRLLTDRGASGLFIGVSLSLFGLPFVALAPLGGRIAERRGPLLAASIALIIADGFMASYGFVPSPVVIAVLGVAEACAQSVAVPGAFAAVARVFSDDRAATGQGWFSAAGTAAAGFAAVLGAPAYGAFGSGAVFAGGAVLSVLIVALALGIGSSGAVTTAADPVARA